MSIYIGYGILEIGIKRNGEIVRIEGIVNIRKRRENRTLWTGNRRD